ncbi:NADH-quinone oxidoreductase subunit NuoK [Saccharicrinis sp. FJH2]|uniref:NADH-quinone oxidoreductase subunit NuoK n=1 Tax=unclassified Saccharicrinis TaxID=2646859 RepID=UPI0035D4EFD8
MHIGLVHYLVVSAILFSIGLYGIIARKHAILVLMGIELILNAANINFIAFAKFGGLNIEGHIAAIFVIILAATEAAIALAIILNIYQHFRHANVDEVDDLKE